MRLSSYLGTLLLFVSLSSQASVDPAQVEDSLSLRDQWMTLTRDVIMDPTWVEGKHEFHYKLSVEGGFQFFRDDLDGEGPTLAFDHAELADALSQASGEPVDAGHLPFEQFRYVDNGQSIRFYHAAQFWQCELTEPHCATIQRQNRPKAFGVVRDVRVEANNTPRSSPNGHYHAVVTDHNLVVQTAEGEPVFRTRDGKADQFYDPETIQWSPDSSSLVVMKVTPGKARLITRVLTAPDDQLEPKPVVQLYPKPGDAVDRDQPVLVQVEKGEAHSMNDELFSQPYQIDRVEWQQDSESFTFRYTERGHQLARLINVNSASGEARALVTETSDTFINQWGSFFQLLHQGDKGAIWLSERDGWAHLYYYNGSGELVNQITSGDWRVRSLVHVDEHNRQVWFSASGMHDDQDPYFEHYFRVNFDGSNLTALTEGNAHHELTFSDHMQYYIAVRSRPDLPPVAELRRNQDGSLVRELARADISRLNAAGFEAPQTFVAKGRDQKRYTRRRPAC